MNPNRIIAPMACAGLCLAWIAGTVLPSAATPDTAVEGSTGCLTFKCSFPKSEIQQKYYETSRTIPFVC